MFASNTPTSPRALLPPQTHTLQATEDIPHIMPAIVLIIGLVCLPLIVVGCIVTAYFKVRRARIHDVERANNTDGTRHINDHGIVLRGITRISSPLERDVVPENVAPVAQPLPEAYRKRANSNTHHPLSSHARIDPPPVISIPDIQAPQPAYTHALSGRYNSTQNTAELMYGEDARVAEAWAKIEKRESLVEPKSRSQAIEIPADKWEDVDLDGNDGGWKKNKRLATPAGVFAIGDSEDEEDEVDVAERSHDEPKDSRSDTPTTSSQILSAIPNRLSWSTTSGQSTRSGSDATKQTLPSSLSRASSMREERATPSRRSSVVSKFKGLSRSGSERIRRTSGEGDVYEDMARRDNALAGFEE
ncbi:hypothetical protein HBI42_164930 [Parastagonospora nodorum]|nr:hypothetical protein HBI43_195470 [Parastagonospora nodorum]KAH6249999.1 hypothetical protein HBI42_164930 [Parastagonospora nodorum]